MRTSGIMGYIFLEISFMGFHDHVNNYQLLKPSTMSLDKKWLVVYWMTAFQIQLGALKTYCSVTQMNYTQSGTEWEGT